jgi:diguanylate cyclase (GGDEF)-like protein/PAS domain S-box-containing protein
VKLPRVSRLSLQLRVMLLAGISVALVLLADAAGRQTAIGRDGRRALAERADLLASIQGDALSVPLWNLDQDQVGAALDALTLDQDFVQASVTKPDGTVLAARQSRHAARAQMAGGSTINVAHDIRYVSHGEVRTLGTLHLSLSTLRLQAALDRDLRGRLVALTVLLGSVLLVVYGALRQFTVPLNMMATALKRLANGDRETPIPARDQDDEVGEVARALQVFRDTAFRLVKAEGSFRALFENAPLGIYGLDENGHVRSVNAALLRICGYDDPDKLVAVLESPGQSGFFVQPGRGEELLQMMRARGGFVGQISEIRRGDGRIAYVSQTARAVRDDGGRILGFSGTVEDVTDRLRRQDEERLRVRAAIESASDAMLIVDENGDKLFANPAFVQCFGEIDGAAGDRDAAGLGEAGSTGGLFSRLTDPGTAAALSAALREGRAWQGEAEILSVNGLVVPMLIRANTIRDEGGSSFGAVVICTDLTDRRLAEARIEHMAHHDWLTGLPNRVLFRQRLNAALQAAPREGVDFAVLCIDLDRFKAVNDTLGHGSGDCLLQMVAARLQMLVRGGDTVARIGGDEFTLIQLEVRHAEQAIRLAERLIHDLGQPYDLGGREVRIGASVGIALAPLHASDPDHLLGFGDAALYEAKSQGRCQVRLFTPDMDQMLRERAQLESDLRRAVAEERLELYVQPQFELATGRLIGAEALLRWTDPVRGAVAPSEFIPVAEECGLIKMLGRWVLSTACRHASTWQEALRVAVNVSPAQFHSGDLIGDVRAILAETGLAPWRLELEITEGVLMRDSETTRSALMQLKALGVRITLDDFGTGYSSLSYLRRMPFDKIKVDRSFVAALGNDPGANALVRSIIALARGMGLETNAEGVETKVQAQFLREEGCHEVQGFYFGRPMPLHAFAQLDDLAMSSPLLVGTGG